MPVEYKIYTVSLTMFITDTGRGFVCLYNLKKNIAQCVRIVCIHTE